MYNWLVAAANPDWSTSLIAALSAFAGYAIPKAIDLWKMKLDEERYRYLTENLDEGQQQLLQDAQQQAPSHVAHPVVPIAGVSSSALPRPPLPQRALPRV